MLSTRFIVASPFLFHARLLIALSSCRSFTRKISPVQCITAGMWAFLVPLGRSLIILTRSPCSALSDPSFGANIGLIVLSLSLSQSAPAALRLLIGRRHNSVFRRFFRSAARALAMELILSDLAAGQNITLLECAPEKRHTRCHEAYAARTRTHTAFCKN